MAKSWLEVQVDLELAHLQPESLDHFRNSSDVIDGSHGNSDHASQRSNRPENWPRQVLNQQPGQLSDLLQKLHSRKMVHEVCAEIPNAFWHRKKHVVELPYEPDFQESMIPTKAKMAHIDCNLTKICFDARLCQRALS